MWGKEIKVQDFSMRFQLTTDYYILREFNGYHKISIKVTQQKKKKETKHINKKNQ